MSQNVSPTRVALLQLKKQQKVAQRGHKLLKDKQDGLIKQFMQVIREVQSLRQQIEEKIREANNFLLMAQSLSNRSLLINALAVPAQKLELEVKTKNVMSVRIPQFTVKISGQKIGYSFNNTSGNLDKVISLFSEVFELMVQLAALEKAAENLAIETEKTRRRYNALENYLLPRIEKSIRYIRMKLEEMARDATIQTMVIKNRQEREERELEAAEERAKANK